MRPAGRLYLALVTRSQRRDVGEVLADRDFIPLPFVTLVPLVMVVKNEGDDVVEVVDETVWCRSVDQPMEAVVEVGEILKAQIHFRKQFMMLPFQGSKLLPY